MRISTSGIAFALAVAVLAAAGPATRAQEPPPTPPPAEGTRVLVWRGCDISKLAFMEPCAAAYEKETGIRFQISAGGAALGIEAAATGAAHLGGTCRALVPGREEGRDLRFVIAAWDALAVVVHPENPLADLSRDQLVAVLKQRIASWKDLGGADERIVVIGRKGDMSGVGVMTRRMILGADEAEFGPTAVLLNSTGPVEKMVEARRDAIAVTGASSARHRKLKLVAVDGVAPTAENIASGRYPYFRPLYLAYRTDAVPEAKRFLEWLLGERGQAVVEASGTVGLRQGAGLVELYKYYDDTSVIDNFRGLCEAARRGPGR